MLLLSLLSPLYGLSTRSPNELHTGPEPEGVCLHGKFYIIQLSTDLWSTILSKSKQ